MEPPRTRWSVVPAIFGLALAQQVLYFAITTALVPAPTMPGAERNWGVTTVFVLGSTLINTAFYSAAWLGLLDATRVAARIKRSSLISLLACLFIFTLAAFLTVQVDPKGPFGSYAQMVALVITLVSAFRIDDARGALAPLENDPLKRDG